MGKLSYINLPLNGKLITALDPCNIGQNFQSLINFEYYKLVVRGIMGQTKINTALPATYIKHKSGIHFKKDFPNAESHILVQGYNSGESASAVLKNDTAIPNQGSFASPVLWTDSAGAGRGRFSRANQGYIAYANGKDCCLWGGDEVNCAKFVNYKPDETYWYDYSDIIQNNLTDSDNLATLYSTTAINVDPEHKIILHFDNNLTNSGSGSYTINGYTGGAPGALTYDATVKKFGTHAVHLNGVDDHIQISDNVDFDLSNGVWTIDTWIRIDALTNINAIFKQFITGSETTDYLMFYVDTDGSLKFDIYDNSSAVVQLASAASAISINTWYHVSVSENNNNWYLHIDAVEVDSAIDTSRAENYNSVIYIGRTGTTYYDGYLDEFRFVRGAAYVEFALPTAAYGATALASIYLASFMPINSFKVYVNTANTTAGAMQVFERVNGGWATVTTLVDNTASGSISLADTTATGKTVTFDSTANTAKPYVIREGMFYWYRIVVPMTNATCKVSQLTLSVPFQQIKEIWDGAYRECITFFYWNTGSSKYIDHTTEVLDVDYDSTNTATYSDLSSLATASYLLAGFEEPQMGLKIKMVDTNVNNNASIITISYSADGGSTWTALQGLTDGTSASGKTFNRTGVITWSMPDNNTEFKTSINNSAQLYFYKITVSGAFSDPVRLDRIQGIPAPKTINSYKFPLYSKNRLMLCSNSDNEKHVVLISSEDTVNVFNGTDTMKLTIGTSGEIKAATSIYSRLGSSIYDIALFFKENSMYGMTGSTIEDFNKNLYPISESIGIAAPETLKTGVIPMATGSVPIVIWQSAKGIYMFDNNAPMLISDDISNFFDENESVSRRLHPSYSNLSTAFIKNNCYHWLFADGNSSGELNREIVFDLIQQKWCEIDRQANKRLQFAFDVIDTVGNKYYYGLLDSGYMQRLDYGTTFDGTAIPYTMWYGDMLFNDKGVMYQTQILRHKLICKSKDTTANTIAITHYGDSATSGTSLTAVDPTTVSGYRIVDSIEHVNLSVNGHIFHSLKYTLTTSDETYGFEPLHIGLLVNELQEDKG